MDKLVQYIDCYNALVLRQRIIVLLAFLSAVYLILYFAFILPVSEKKKNLVLENAYLSSLYVEADQVRKEKESEGKALGIVGLNNKLFALKDEVELLNLELKEYFSIASSTDDLMGIVKDLVSTTKGLTLESIELLPAESISLNMSSNQIEAPVSIGDENEGLIENEMLVYKHKISLEVVGDYTSLTSYMQKIESLEWGLFVQDVSYKVKTYPQSTASIILYSLSLSGDNHEV